MTNILLNSYRFDAPWLQEGLQDYLHPGMVVTVFPLAFRVGELTGSADWEARYNKETGPFAQGLKTSFGAYGISPAQIEWVNPFEPARFSLPERIAASDVLYFCGGLPDLMLRRLTELGLVERLRQFDGVVMGDSAGALIQFDTYHVSPDRDYPGFQYHSGLGYLREFEIEVHYEGLPIQEESIDQVVSQRGLPVYGLYVDGALVVDQGTVTPLGRVKWFFTAAESAGTAS